MTVVQVDVTADDGAYSRSIDDAIVALASDHLVTRVSAFSNFGRLESLAKRLPKETSLGVHLTISSGPPVSRPADVRSLVDANGQFHRPHPSTCSDIGGSIQEYSERLADRAQPREMAKEFSAQLKRFKETTGCSPCFLTVHHDLDRHSMIGEVLSEVAPNLPGRKASMVKGLVAKISCVFLPEGCNLHQAMVLLERAFEDSLRASRTCCRPSEFVVHPSIDTSGLDSFTIYREQRVIEFKAIRLLARQGRFAPC